MGELQIKTQKTPEGLLIAMSGVVDGDLSFDNFVVSDTDRVLIFDLDNVSLINSVGIRTWVGWMRQIARGRTFIFRRCSKVIVDQMNALEGFVPPGAKVESFYVPYYCESCDETQRILFSSGKEFDLGTADRPYRLTPPSSVPCKLCNGPTEMDVLLSKYFRFLKTRPD